MNEKKRRFIHDDIIVGLIYDFEAEERLNGVMKEEMSGTSKGIAYWNP
jgi:hypothetical protein